MTDMELFRAYVRAVVEDERRQRVTSRATWCLVAFAAVTALGTLALVVLALLTLVTC